MFLRARTAFAAALLVLAAPTASHAALSPYVESFEGMVATDPAALTNAGWLVYGNVFSPDHLTYLYGYGPFGAPNAGNAFCAIDAGQGGLEQGLQQLSVYNDYNNTGAHTAGDQVESNVYREQTIAAGDAGTHWTFQFDAKLGNLLPPSTALAFIKTLDPNNGYATTNFVSLDMTAIPATWHTYTISIDIGAGLVGQILQIGFANTATSFVSSGVYYDNLVFEQRTTAVGDVGRAMVLDLRPNAPNPFSASTRLDFSLRERGIADVSVYDVVGRRVATLFHGLAEAGPHSVAWNGRLADGRVAAAGVYHGVLSTADGRVTRSMVLAR